MNGKELYDDASSGSGCKCSCDPMLEVIRGLDEPTILEIGVARGLGMWRMLTECPNIKRAFGIDPWCDGSKSDQILEARGVLSEWLGDKLSLVVDYSEHAADMFPDGMFDYVFIDGDHGYDACKRDIAMWLPKVKSGGILAGHDYKSGEPGVVDAVKEFIAESGMKLIEAGGWVWYVIA